MGIYFTDMRDYAGCYARYFQNRRQNFNRTIPIKETFSCIASEISYDEQKLKKIYDFSFFLLYILN